MATLLDLSKLEQMRNYLQPAPAPPQPAAAAQSPKDLFGPNLEGLLAEGNVRSDQPMPGAGNIPLDLTQELQERGGADTSPSPRASMAERVSNALHVAEILAYRGDQRGSANWLNIAKEAHAGLQTAIAQEQAEQQQASYTKALAGGGPQVAQGGTLHIPSPVKGGPTLSLTGAAHPTAEQDAITRALTQELGRAPTPAEFLKREQQQKIEQAEAVGRGRAAAFGDIRQKTYIDTANENQLVTKTATEFNEINKAEPGRLIEHAAAQPQLNRLALVEDVRGALQNTREKLNAMKTDFTPMVAAQLALVLKHPDSGALGQFLTGRIGQTLDPATQDYVIALRQLHENAAAAMRSILFAGQGTDMLRGLILSTTPSAVTPSRGYARKQLDAQEAQLNRLARPIPGGLKLNPLQEGPPAGASSPHAETPPPSQGGPISRRLDLGRKSMDELLQQVRAILDRQGGK